MRRYCCLCAWSNGLMAPRWIEMIPLLCPLLSCLYLLRLCPLSLTWPNDSLRRLSLGATHNGETSNHSCRRSEDDPIRLIVDIFFSFFYSQGRALLLICTVEASSVWAPKMNGKSTHLLIVNSSDCLILFLFLEWLRFFVYLLRSLSEMDNDVVIRWVFLSLSSHSYFMRSIRNSRKMGLIHDAIIDYGPVLMMCEQIDDDGNRDWPCFVVGRDDLRSLPECVAPLLLIFRHFHFG